MLAQPPPLTLQDMTQEAVIATPAVAKIFGPNGGFGDQMPPALINVLQQLASGADVSTNQALYQVDGDLVSLVDLSGQYSLAKSGLLGVSDVAGTLAYDQAQIPKAMTTLEGDAAYLTTVTPTLTITAAPAANGNELFLANTATLIDWEAGETYSGPDTVLQNQFIAINRQHLGITATAPNNFIKLGGNDAIDVSRVAGDNVIDAGIGSNYLVGGALGRGFDSFVLDERQPATAVWSTVSNFHSGDVITVLGPSKFNTVSPSSEPVALDPGVITLAAQTPPGAPSINLTILGQYGPSALTNGHIGIAYLHDAVIGNYVQIVAK